MRRARLGDGVITERDNERHERPAPLVWLRRFILLVSIVVTGWLLLGGSSAEAATTGVLDATGSPSLAAVDAIRAEEPGGTGIVEPAALVRATDAVAEQGRQRSQSLGSDSAASTGGDRARRVEGVDGAVRAVEPPAESSLDTFGGVLESTVSPVTPVERSGQATSVVGPQVTPTLGAVIAAAQPVVGPVSEVTPATPGEPGVAGNDRETPGSSVEAPRGSVLAYGPESSAAPADSARPSSGSSPAFPPGGHLLAGSATGGTAGGPVLPEPVLPVPGPSHDVPDGIASGGGAPGSVDRGQNVFTDTSPLVVAPELVSSVPAASRSTGHPERPIRPSVSPD
jgi:hypothetical protein